MAPHAPTLISREPWWAVPPRPDQTEMECDWGWLELWSDGSFRFDPTRPSDEEIANRKACRIPSSFTQDANN